jgi:hypothetical protein
MTELLSQAETLAQEQNQPTCQLAMPAKRMPTRQRSVPDSNGKRLPMPSSQLESWVAEATEPIASHAHQTELRRLFFFRISTANNSHNADASVLERSIR